jgi:hypothetical protein
MSHCDLTDEYHMAFLDHQLKYQEENWSILSKFISIYFLYSLTKYFTTVFNPA